MSSGPSEARTEEGFEIDGRIYPPNLSEPNGKDWQLIERFTGLTPGEWEEACLDADRRAQATMIYAVIAIAVRVGEPDWSVARIYEYVANKPVSEMAYISAGEEDESPPAEGAPAAPTSEDEPVSPPESSPSSTQPVPIRPATSSEIPPSSINLGSPTTTAASGQAT